MCDVHETLQTRLTKKNGITQIVSIRSLKREERFEGVEMVLSQLLMAQGKGSKVHDHGAKNRSRKKESLLSSQTIALELWNIII